MYLMFIYNTQIFQKSKDIFLKNTSKMRINTTLLCLLLIISPLLNSQPTQQQPSSPSEPSKPSPPSNNDPEPLVTKDDVILNVGQIMPGQIDITKSNQAMHYVKIDSLEKKFLFIRINTFQKVKMGIGIYSNQTRQLIYACQDNNFDSCYVSSQNLKPNKVYVVLLVVSDSLKYNFYSYWADIQHLKPNTQTKFMFDETNPTQLFHLQFQQNIQKQTQQIRIVLKPQTSRMQGDNLKIFANLGFKGQPTAQQHQIRSVRVWGDSQAIILNKQKFANQAGISLYIVGNVQTVYTLQTQFIKNTTHSLNPSQTINQYLQPNKTATYKVNIGQLKDTDLYVIKISSFNGQMSPSFFYDAALTQPFQKSSYQYMSDMQFNIMKDDLKAGSKQLYMLIRSYDLEVTYQISVQLRQKTLAYEMTQNVFQFAMLTPNKTQTMYFYSHLWDSSQYQKLKSLKFDISTINVQGSPSLKYFYCLPESPDQQCTNSANPQNAQSLKQLQPFSKSQIGSKNITTLQISQQYYKKINNVQKRLMIVIQMTTVGMDVSGIAVEYSNPNQIRILREGRSFEDKVRDREFKYYKYINNNPKVAQIRIHVNQISGLLRARARRSSFFEEKDGKQDVTDYKIDKDLPDTIIIKQNTTSPIYLQIYGVVNSLYTISITAIHSQHLISNSLIMAQDIEYEVKLLPYQHMNIQIHPIQPQVMFQFYGEGGMVMVCQVDAKDMCIGGKVVSSAGEIKIDARDKRQVRIRIGNYIDSNQNTPNSVNKTSISLPQKINKVKLSLIYHASTTAHCQQRRINKVYAQNIISGSCFKFHIPLSEQLQIMAVRSDLGPVQHIFLVCNKKVIVSQVNDRWIIKKEQVQDACKKDKENLELKMLIVDQRLKGEVKMDYSVQYKGDIITLLDGVAYTAKGYSTPQTSLRNFFYQIIDQDRDINIILYNKKGIQKFYATILSKQQKYSPSITQATAKFNSKSSTYYTNPYIKIIPSQIAQFKCGRSCVLSLSVYSTEKAGSQYQYALQITQNHVLLKQDHIKEDFLSKGSVRFYQYQSKHGKTSIAFKVSDNNRKCVRTFMSKNPFPTASNYYTKQNEGTIIYEKTQKGTFYFAVQAIQDCPHTVSISQGQSSITKIQYGQYYDISLQAGQQKWFYTKHITNSTFKIISLKQHGQIHIFANQTTLDKEVFDNLDNKKIDKNKFGFKSSYSNTLVVASDDKNFCYNCQYLICVMAMRTTSGSIFLGSSNSKISINDKKIVFDQILDKNAITFATFYKVSDGNLLMKVHSGSINFQITTGTQKFTKKFTQSKKVYHQPYNFTRQDSSSYAPLQIRVTADKVPALYSFQFQPSETKNVYENKVTPGQHTYLYLYEGNSQCVVGTLSQKQQEIYISAESSERNRIQLLNVTVKIDGNETTDYLKQIVGNIISINFNSSQTFFKQVKKYQICLTLPKKNQSLSLYVFQSKSVNLIHSDTQTLVRNQARFVLYPFNDIILDLFECRGSAQLYYSSSLDSLREKQGHKLDVIGIPGQSHAVKISSSSSIYLEIVAEMATVLWMPIIQKQERGLGYFKYSIGALEYQSHFNTIIFKIGGVFKAKQTSTKPVSVTYTLFVSNSKLTLQQAVMCQKNAPDTLVAVSMTYQTAGTDPSYFVSIEMNKQQITKKFSQNSTLYWNVVADMKLQPPASKNPSSSSEQPSVQNYRFIYYQQTVPSQIFRQSKIQSLHLTLLITLVVVVVLGFFLVACVFVKYIVPAIGRLKNRVLVQEKQDPKDKSIPLPPSSERNQREAAGTEEGMN